MYPTRTYCVCYYMTNICMFISSVVAAWACVHAFLRRDCVPCTGALPCPLAAGVHAGALYTVLVCVCCILCIQLYYAIFIILICYIYHTYMLYCVYRSWLYALSTTRSSSAALYLTSIYSNCSLCFSTT